MVHPQSGTQRSDRLAQRGLDRARGTAHRLGRLAHRQLLEVAQHHRLALALRIGQAVDDLYARNVCCVCAKGYQQDGRDYPTSFASTVGVTYAQLRTAQLQHRPSDLVEFAASGVGNTVAWQHGSTRRVTGSSYATPLVTALLARWLELDKTLTPYQLKTLLHAYATRQAAGWWQPWMEDAERTPG